VVKIKFIMNKKNQLKFSLFCLFIIYSFSCGDIQLNKSVEIADGAKHKDDITTVNGSITIGKNCEIKGSCQSINGAIEIGEGSIVSDISSVNGGISIERNVRVNGDLHSINGSLTIKSGTVVTQNIDVINQFIRIDGSEIGGDITIDNGDIFLGTKTTVEGNIFVSTERMIEIEGSKRRSVLIEISDGSVVKGNIKVGDETLEAKVMLRDGGKVLGSVTNAEVIDQNN
jgi:hypothetical protein